MKDIFIRFSVPDDFDAPSEVLDEIKQMLLDSLWIRRNHPYRVIEQREEQLADVLLIES